VYRFLPEKHPLRKKGLHWKGKADHRTKPPPHFKGEEIFEMVKNLRVVFGKGDGSVPVPHDANGRAPMWKKKSIFWELPYWEILKVRNAIDVMHLTKNLCLNVLGFLGCYKNSKDTLEARRGLKNIHRNEAPPIEVDEEEVDPEEVEEKEQDYLGPASYTLSKEEKDIIFDFLNSMKVPSGYSSNIKGIISMKDKKFTNLKAHDCHMLMTQLLPVALRGVLPEKV
jgi:hypothetical protein